MSKVYFIRTDREVIECGCVGYGWGELNFSEFVMLSDLLSAWKNLQDNDHYNWQQERQISAFYTLAKGDVVIAVGRESPDIFIGAVAGDKSYNPAFTYSSNLVAVDFIQDDNGGPQPFNRAVLSDELQARLKSARMTITDLSAYADEVASKYTYLQALECCDGKTQQKLAQLYEVQSQQIQSVKTNFSKLIQLI